MIAIINGSPNSEKGNCGAIVKKIEEIMAEQGASCKIINSVEVLKTMKFPFCTACMTPCEAVCSKGTALENAFDIVREAEGVIMISPVYFGSISGELKALWDLFRYLRREKAFYNKFGAAVSVGATKFGGQETALRTMHEMMMVQGMLIAGDAYGENMGHFGAAFVRPAVNDSEGIKSLERTVMRMIEITKK